MTPEQHYSPLCKWKVYHLRPELDATQGKVGYCFTGIFRGNKLALMEKVLLTDKGYVRLHDYRYIVIRLLDL